MDWDKILALHITNKRLVSRICKELLSILVMKLIIKIQTSHMDKKIGVAMQDDNAWVVT